MLKRTPDQVRERLARGKTLKNNPLTKELNMGRQGYYPPVHILDYWFHRGETKILPKINTHKTYARAKPARPRPAAKRRRGGYVRPILYGDRPMIDNQPPFR